MTLMAPEAQFHEPYGASVKQIGGLGWFESWKEKNTG